MATTQTANAKDDATNKGHEAEYWRMADAQIEANLKRLRFGAGE